jgi:hypothetical protein
MADGLDWGHVRREHGEKLANCGWKSEGESAKETNASLSAYRRKRMMVDTQ